MSDGATHLLDRISYHYIYMRWCTLRCARLAILSLLIETLTLCERAWRSVPVLYHDLPRRFFFLVGAR